MSLNTGQSIEIKVIYNKKKEISEIYNVKTDLKFSELLNLISKTVKKKKKKFF
jgi:hypothetical protein